MPAGMFDDVFGNGTSLFAEYIGEHIVRFEIGQGEAIAATVFLAGHHIRELHAAAYKIVRLRLAILGRQALQGNSRMGSITPFDVFRKNGFVRIKHLP